MFNIIISGKKGTETMGIFSYDNDIRVYANEWKKNLEFPNMFNFVRLKKLKPGSKYVIYINLYGHFTNKNFNSKYNFFNFRNETNETLLLPDRVKRDSQHGLVHWIIDYSTESQILSDAIFNFSELCNQLNTIPKNITLLTGSETNGLIGENVCKNTELTGYNVITAHSLYTSISEWFTSVENRDSYAEQKLNDILNKKINKYKSLCYNRRPRPHRTAIIAYIIKNQFSKECLYSLGANENVHKNWNLKEEFPELSEIITRLITDKKDIYPHIKEKNITLRENQYGITGWDHGLNSYFQLVTETVPDYIDYTFITEKSLKPFVMMQPFIQYGSLNNIQNLKAYGFDVFEKWIDHSYDNETDKIKRLRMVLREFDRLQNISHKKWTVMLKEMVPSLLHNYQLIKKSPIRNFSSQLIPILYDFYKGN